MVTPVSKWYIQSQHDSTYKRPILQALISLNYKVLQKLYAKNAGLKCIPLLRCHTETSSNLKTATTSIIMVGEGYPTVKPSTLSTTTWRWRVRSMIGAKGPSIRQSDALQVEKASPGPYSVWWAGYHLFYFCRPHQEMKENNVCHARPFLIRRTVVRRNNSNLDPYMTPISVMHNVLPYVDSLSHDVMVEVSAVTPAVNGVSSASYWVNQPTGVRTKRAHLKQKRPNPVLSCTTALVYWSCTLRK